jgi:2,4-dienoyl-CoA reductase-like NADH-dependent reductase (Old Yellow Enzyme family)
LTVQEVNVDVVLVLADMAASAGVKRFVHMSSGSTKIMKQSNYQEKVPFYFRWFCRDSLFSNLSQSSYARTKLEGENYVLSKCVSEATATKGIHDNGIAGGSRMRSCVLRPQAVWGRGDPLATETILTWPDWMPHFLVGDPTGPMIFCRVDNLAKFVMLADAGLMHNPEVLSGKGFDIGDSSVSSFLQLHWRMLAGKRCVSTHSFPFVPTIVLSVLWFTLEAVGLAARFETDGKKLSTLVLPDVVVFVMVMLAQFIDWLYAHKPSFSFVRVLTANNMAYSMPHVVTVPTLSTFEDDCVAIFSAASRRSQTAVNKQKFDFAQWLAKLQMDASSDSRTLTQSYLQSQFLSLLPQQLESSGIKVLNKSSSKLSLSEPLAMGQTLLRNRVIKAATFESMCDPATGVPTDELVRFHARQAAGGVGMTVVAYGSVSADGRSFPTQLCLRSPDVHVATQTEAALESLCRSVRESGGRSCLQLTHAGAFADSKCNGGKPAVGPSSILNPLTLKFSVSLEGDEAGLARIETDFVHAVEVCRRVGFDAVELHLGHGYLLSQFLSSRTNPQHAWSPQDRLAFPLRVLKSVIRCAHAIDRPGDRYLAVLVKFNVSELTEADLPIGDVRIFAKAFNEAGADLLVPSGGHVMTNGLHMLRGGRPIQEMASAQTNWLKRLVIGWFGEYLIAPEIYREAFFREQTLSGLLGVVPLSKVCLIGGLHDLHSVELPVRLSGFGAVQMGRALLADPDWCIKMGIHTPEAAKEDDGCPTRSTSVRNAPLRVCDSSNRCIVGSTMALQPLRCAKYDNIDW